MAKILFKSPKVEITKLAAGETAPAAGAEWEEILSENIKQDSVAIATTAGTNSKVFDDNGNVVASHTGAAQYAINLSTYAEIEEIVDDNGVVADAFAIRITEKKTGKGYVMENCEVSVSVAYTAADGATNAFIFNGLNPTTGKVLKPYEATAQA